MVVIKKLLLLLFIVVISNCEDTNKEVCKSDGVVLNCTYVGLNAIPSSWNDTMNYTTVDLSRNEISIVEQFAYSEEITKIILQHNNISKIVDKAFANVPSLRKLDLSFNYLTYLTLTEFIFQGNNSVDYYEPTYIEVLILSHNSLHALKNNVFEHLPNLTELYLDHNPFTKLDSVTILAISSSYRNLRLLDLSYCGLDNIPSGFLHTLINLETLNLEGNQFIQVPPSLGERSASLIKLILNENPFENLNFTTKLEKLEELEISKIDTVQIIKTGDFENLIGLKIFKCNENTQLQKIESHIFHEDTRLKVFECSKNAIETIDGNIGVNWEQIESFDMRYNPYNCDCQLSSFVLIVMPNVEKTHPQQINDYRCAQPHVIRNVQIVKIPMQLCSTNAGLIRRLGTIASLLLVIGLCGLLTASAIKGRRNRHPPLPVVAEFKFVEDGDDVIHYVRLKDESSPTTP